PLLLSLTIPRPPCPTLFPYTTLFRSSTVELLGVLLSATALSGLLSSARWAWEPWLASRMGRWSDGPHGRLPMLVGFLLLGASSLDRKSTRLNSSHVKISYAVFCLKKK